MPLSGVQTEARLKDLTKMGVKTQLVCVGRKGATYFKRRPQYEISRECRAAPRPHSAVVTQLVAGTSGEATDPMRSAARHQVSWSSHPLLSYRTLELLLSPTRPVVHQGWLPTERPDWLRADALRHVHAGPDAHH